MENKTVKSYSEFLLEGIRSLNDSKTDDFIKNNWDNSANTYKYNAEAVMEMGKVWSDVVVTKDKEFFHIPGVQSVEQAKISDEIIKKYNLEEVK